MLVAGAPQYTHRPLSRAKMARLVSGTVERCGTRTNRVSRTTEGTGSAPRTLWTHPAPSFRDTAFCDSTSTMARRWGTTHKGSNVALRINALATGPPWSVRHRARAGGQPHQCPPFRSKIPRLWYRHAVGIRPLDTRKADLCHMLTKVDPHGSQLPTGGPC